MYQPRGQFGNARARYQDVDLASRIEGATPHQLVAVMFEELLKTLDAMAVAVRRDDLLRRGRCQSRALAILKGIETSLDFEQGGDIAEGLASIYREASRLILAGRKGNDAAAVAAAREMVGEIASAWEAIGAPAAP